jgi:hypothetical protein
MDADAAARGALAADAVVLETGIDAARAAPMPETGNGHAPTNTLGHVLDRAAFLSHAKRSRPLTRVELPWLDTAEQRGTHVYVRGLSANGRDAFDDRAYTVRPDRTIITHVEGLRALLVMLCTCDADGKRLFTEEDLPQLQELDAKTSDAIYTVASRASGLTQKDVDELIKNSGSAPGSDSQS